MYPSPLSRRQFLTATSLGVGGTLLAPMLGQVRAHADGADALRQRWVFVTISNGLNANFIQPKSVERKGKKADRVTEAKIGKADLPFVLEPLGDLADRVTVVQGLSGKVAGGGHYTQYGALGAYPGVKGAVLGETVDLALAKTRKTIFPHVGLGVVTSDQTVAYGRSARAANQPVPTQCRPDLAFNGLFGSAAGTPEAKRTLAVRGNVLDFLAEDIKRAEANLGAEQRERLGHYLRACEDMKDRRSRLNEVESTLRKHAPVVSDKYKSDDPMDRLDAHFDLGTAALISGLTDVLTLSTGVGAQWNMNYKSLGITLGSHPIGHGQGENGKTASELAQIIRRFHIELIARLAKKLKAVPEGDGTMLDNTVIVFLSDAAENHHSTCLEWPMVLVGGMKGKLKPGGRYLEYPYYGAAGHRTVANLYTTLLHAASDKRDTFGMPDLALKDLDQKGPLSELLA